MLIYVGLESNGIPVSGVFSIFGLDMHGAFCCYFPCGRSGGVATFYWGYGLATKGI